HLEAEQIARRHAQRAGIGGEGALPVADDVEEEAQAPCFDHPGHAAQRLADVLSIEHGHHARPYIVTTAAPPRPRLCCSAMRAPSTCVRSAQPRNWRVSS